MAKIKVEKCFQDISVDNFYFETKNRVEGLVKEKLAPFGTQEIDWNDSAQRGKIIASKFSGEIFINNHSIEIEVDLPFLLSPFKGRIKETLKEKLNTLFV